MGTAKLCKAKDAGLIIYNQSSGTDGALSQKKKTQK